jgi:hypothetical protein
MAGAFSSAFSSAFDIVGGWGTTVAVSGACVALANPRAPGSAYSSASGRAVALAESTTPTATRFGGTGRSLALADARAVASKLTVVAGRLACLAIVRGSTSTGSLIEARDGASVTLSLVRAELAAPPYEWRREIIGVTPVKARAAFRLEAFDYEDIEIFGTIGTVATLAGANLQFIGWDSDGHVAWDSELGSGSATVTVTDATARTYAATTSPKSADVYRWQIRITNDGQRTVPVWGYLTITASDAAIPPDTIAALTGE